MILELIWNGRLFRFCSAATQVFLDKHYFKFMFRSLLYVEKISKIMFKNIMQFSYNSWRNFSCDSSPNDFQQGIRNSRILPKNIFKLFVHSFFINSTITQYLFCNISKNSFKYILKRYRLNSSMNSKIILRIPSGILTNPLIKKTSWKSLKWVKMV